jgi:hypothetical protein
MPHILDYVQWTCKAIWLFSCSIGLKLKFDRYPVTANIPIPISGILITETVLVSVSNDIKTDIGIEKKISYCTISVSYHIPIMSIGRILVGYQIYRYRFEIKQRLLGYQIPGIRYEIKINKHICIISKLKGKHVLVSV